MRALLRLAALAAIAAATPALAQHAAHGQDAAQAPSASDPAAAFAAINDRMHADAPQQSTGNVDVDFLRNMIPHHEGALAMAEVALAHARDPEVRRLAEAIIVAQKAEIAEMQAMIERLAPAAD